MFRRLSKRSNRPNLAVQPSNPGRFNWVQQRPENVLLRAPETASELRVDSLSKLRRLAEESSSLTKTTSVVDRHSTLLSVCCLDCMVVVTFFSAQSSVVCLTFSNRVKRALSNHVRESCRTRSREPFNAVPIGRGRHLNYIYIYIIYIYFFDCSYGFSQPASSDRSWQQGNDRQNSNIYRFIIYKARSQGRSSMSKGYHRLSP